MTTDITPFFRVGTLVLALSLSACASMSGVTPSASPRDAASLGLNAGQAGASIATEWWRELGDEQLNRLIAQALDSSPSLQLAQARLARAQAVTGLADAATKPQLTGTLDLTHQRYTENGAAPPPLAGSIRDSGTLQLGASWELDFFGKNRAALEAAVGMVNAAQADAQVARLLLASQVVRSYVQLARINDQLGVARRTLAQREQILRLVRDRVDAGLDTRLELRQSEGSLPEARRQILALQEQAALTRHVLAALVGQPKIAPPISSTSLSVLKSVAMPLVLPADLLGRRADIVAARWRVQASIQEVANAKSRFYPNVNLMAFAGLSSIGLDRLLEAGSRQWGVGPALRLPIFDGGQLRANLRGKTAELDAAVASYNASVIDAVRDVSDQLASAQSITQQQTEQHEAQAAAESAYGIAVQRYEAGLGNYLQVLAAESAVLNQRHQALDLAARALETQVALIRALGGGYDGVGMAGGTSGVSAIAARKQAISIHSEEKQP